MLFDSLTMARATGKAVRVIYHAGSQPGSVRDIIPVVVAEKEVRAVDVITATEKTFKIEFLALAPVQCNAPQYDPSLGKTPSEFDTQTIEDLSTPIADELASLGWHVLVDKDEVGLFSFFKNGKPKKTPEVRLTFQQYVTEFIMDDDGELNEAKALSNRPYRLESKNFASARTFAKLSSAWPKFLEEAQSRAPNKRT